MIKADGMGGSFAGVEDGHLIDVGNEQASP